MRAAKRGHGSSRPSSVDWLPAESLRTAEELFFNPTRGQVEARCRTYWADLMLEETPVAIGDAAAAAELLARRRGSSSIAAAGSGLGRRKFLARVRWLADALPDLQLPTLDDGDLKQLLPEVCHGLRSLDELRSADWLVAICRIMVGYERLGGDRSARAGGTRSCRAATGMRSTTKSASRRCWPCGFKNCLAWRRRRGSLAAACPCCCILLGPNYRPQQVTADLASFWQNGYPEVKKELRRRYPKHAWPDDPLTAPAIRSGLKRDLK